MYIYIDACLEMALLRVPDLFGGGYLSRKLSLTFPGDVEPKIRTKVNVSIALHTGYLGCSEYTEFVADPSDLVALPESRDFRRAI